ncbi:MAG: ureidoglycolate lyase [Candidatus Rokubacteria bacterium]|nr:ureidoglycolate lyase [Candidatus Rokubacteria bacterium]MBI3825148.1 ureidoglycolate lyase [Candidatus Rokubacteria bacterium]
MKHPLKVEPLTADSFAPFGEVIGPADREPDFEGRSGTQLWGLDFEVDGRLQLGYIRVPYQRLSFSMMEQHDGVTQGFIPARGPAALVAVAPPTEPGRTPRPPDVRAFLLDGSRGYILKRRTWHSLDRFPLYPPYGDWVILTGWETTQDLLASGDRLGAKLTRAVDFEQEYGIVFEFDMAHVS